MKTTENPRSLNMAVEDRAKIVKMFVVTLNRLSITVNTDRKLLWEKVTGLMTDSVTKNLQIENMVCDFSILCRFRNFCYFLCPYTLIKRFRGVPLSFEVMTQNRTLQPTPNIK